MLPYDRFPLPKRSMIGGNGNLLDITAWVYLPEFP